MQMNEHGLADEQYHFTAMGFFNICDIILYTWKL